MEHAFGNAARQLWLSSCECGSGSSFVTSVKRGFNLLYKGADATDASAIDFGAAIIAADALASLRRIGHVCPQIIQIVTAWQQRTGADEAPPLERLYRFVNRENLPISPLALGAVKG
jgi:hypothetical protein